MTDARILVVEDEIIVSKDIENRLKNLGYAVSAVASSGEEAINKAEETHPDLVLMDIILKGDMDGMESAKQIRDRFNIPVVYLTAYADDKTLQRAKITEPYGYILKPFEERELHTAIEMALCKHEIESRLKESEDWLSTTLNSIGDAVIAADKEGCVTFMNPVAQSLTGWKEEESVGKPLKDVFNIINEETGKQISAPVARAIQEGVVFGLGNQIILTARDGVETPINHSAAPIKDDRGNVTGVVLVFRDIAERKRADEALRESEASYRELADSITDVFFAVDRDLRYTYWNKASEKLMGIPAKDAIGKSIFEIFPDREETRKAVAMYQKVLKTQQPQNFVNEYRLGSKDFFFGISTYPTKDGLSVFVKDITERKKAEELTKKQLIDIRKLDEMKDNFLSVVSHELRTPLTPIQGYLDLLQSGEYGELNYEQKMALDTCMESSKRLKSMIDNLVEVTRLESRKVELSTRRVNLTKLIGQVLREFKPNVDEKNIRISYKRNIPPSVVRGDEEKLRAAIDNLVGNAIKFTPDGGRILISVKQGKRSVHFEVKDSGVGIPREHQSRIFDKFYQADTSTSREFSGMGLGLAICKEIIDLHGGRMWVKSKPGEGSEFHFNIPLR